MALQRVLHDNQQVYIFGERLRGVQSCTASWSSPEVYVNSIGVEGGLVGTTIQESLRADFDVERLMITPHDPIIDYFETTDLSGEIHYGDSSNNFAFNGGYISSYSCSCAIGEVPSLNFSVVAYGNSGGGAASLGRGKEADDTIVIANPGSISVDVEGYASNAIQSFELSIAVDKTPVNVIGQLSPAHFIPSFPVEVNCQFVLNVQDYESSQLFDVICSPKKQDINLVFMDCDRSKEVRRFFLPDSKLIDYSQAALINQGLEATFSYKCLVNNLANIKKLLKGQAF